MGKEKKETVNRGNGEPEKIVETVRTGETVYLDKDGRRAQGAGRKDEEKDETESGSKGETEKKE